MHANILANLRRTVSEGNIAPTALPLAPEISLYLIREDYPRGRLPHEEMLAIMNSPAYWAFCWASGQVLARYVLDHPDQVAGKSVLDFGSGSGVAAIAAAIAGAKHVVACDNDPLAIEASRANAALNKVEIEYMPDPNELEQEVDLVIAADVLYDRDNIEWLERLPTIAPDVIVADSRVKDVEVYGYEVIDRVTATTVPDLDELAEYNDVSIYRSIRTLR